MKITGILTVLLSQKRVLFLLGTLTLFISLKKCIFLIARNLKSAFCLFSLLGSMTEPHNLKLAASFFFQ